MPTVAQKTPFAAESAVQHAYHCHHMIIVARGILHRSPWVSRNTCAPTSISSSTKSPIRYREYRAARSHESTTVNIRLCPRDESSIALRGMTANHVLLPVSTVARRIPHAIESAAQHDSTSPPLQLCDGVRGRHSPSLSVGWPQRLCYYCTSMNQSIRSSLRHQELRLTRRSRVCSCDHVNGFVRGIHQCFPWTACKS